MRLKEEVRETVPVSCDMGKHPCLFGCIVGDIDLAEKDHLASLAQDGAIKSAVSRTTEKQRTTEHLRGLLGA